ncbi:AAA family ATPase [Azohydromonas sp.]|uniref:Lon protease family protein n=1 Tax=Azohydromonas sp. TaxID=1872666 RepID=UPI002C1A0802|nr:AAA family ATPase [Azohydromonas sp.]HMM85845.1 AAA family ATPase [Azohydromonas sp.]
MPTRALPAQELVRRCDPAFLDAAEPAAPDDAQRIVGQERARAAVEFGIATRHDGFHLFVMGPPGSGRRSLARRVIAGVAANDARRRSDWVYVNNFERAHQPIALELPAAQGTQLCADMKALVADLRTLIAAVFESEEYATQVERINHEFKDRAEQALREVAQEAQRRDLAMIRTPVGFTFAPQKDGEVMSPEVFEALPEDRRAELQKAVSELQDQLLRMLRAHMRMRKEHADRVRALDRSMTLLAVEHAVDDIKARYAALPRVCAYLDAVRADVIDNANDFRTRDDDEGSGTRPERQAELARYEVNLVLDAGASDGAPIVEADLPSYQHLVGRVDHIARFGALLTDFRMIKGGLLHRANGGYLLIDAVKLLQQPFAWAALKRALLRREIRLESLAEMFSVVSTVQLEPEPIPLQVKVVLVGERWVCQLLQAVDPEFDELFRVLADLGDDMPRGADTERALARMLAVHLQSRQLLEPSGAALARLIDHGVRLAGDATRITAQVRRLLDVLLEAEHGARARGEARIEAQDVAAAIAARRERVARVHERVHDAVQRDILMIATTGERVGQVNGLSVYEIGNESFGRVTRISATSRLGDGQVIDVQRETQLGGPLHAKGVMILSSFLAARYSRLQPYAIAASLVFEQTYGLVEGDSASLGELVALLSSIADVPVRQCWAVTGSVNQFGDVQAIGGVNEKVEGFFDVCAARGLDGTQGVLIPEANVSHLMLRDDVVDAVAAGRFAVHAVRSVDDALERMTGLPAGDPGLAQADTVNGRIALRLREYARLRRGEPRVTRRRAPGMLRRVVDDGGRT